MNAGAHSSASATSSPRDEGDDERDEERMKAERSGSSSGSSGCGGHEFHSDERWVQLESSPAVGHECAGGRLGSGRVRFEYYK